MHKLLYEILNEARIGKAEAQGLFGQLTAAHSLERSLGLEELILPMRGWAASPDFLLAMTEEMRRISPRTVIECGSGTSTIIIAKFLRMQGSGHVYSLDHDPKFAERTREQLKKYSLDRWATVVDAPLVQVEGADTPWYSLSNLPRDMPPADFAVIDGPPGSIGLLARYPALSRLNRLLSETCAVLVDDADREGERLALLRWSQEFPSFIQQRLDCERGAVLMHRTQKTLAPVA